MPSGERDAAPFMSPASTPSAASADSPSAPAAPIISPLPLPLFPPPFRRCGRGRDVAPPVILPGSVRPSPLIAPPKKKKEKERKEEKEEREQERSNAASGAGAGARAMRAPEGRGAPARGRPSVIRNVLRDPRWG